jgi:hypothetical protein
MIGPQRVRQQPRLGPLERPRQDLLEGFTVAGFIFARACEDRHPGVGPIQHVVEIPTFSNSMRTTYAPQLRGRPSQVANRFLATFFCPGDPSQLVPQYDASRLTTRCSSEITAVTFYRTSAVKYLFGRTRTNGDSRQQ